jgi:hypothetical protein
MDNLSCSCFSEGTVCEGGPFWLQSRQASFDACRSNLATEGCKVLLNLFLKQPCQFFQIKSGQLKPFLIWADRPVEWASPAAVCKQNRPESVVAKGGSPV